MQIVPDINWPASEKILESLTKKYSIYKMISM